VSTPQTRATELPDLLAYAGGVLGSVQLIADRSWDYGEGHVIEVVDSSGEPWVVKRCYRRKVFIRETDALRDWAPALGNDLAPRLHHTDPDSQTFIMTRLAGTAGTADTPDSHRQAGVITRRLHDLEPRLLLPELSETLTRNMEGWLTRMPGIVPAEDVDYARAHLRDIAALPPTYGVPAHGDNQPRNWLVDDAGTTRLIDFGRAGIDAWLRDIERMYFAEWTVDPELQDAFLDGYGHDLSDDDHAFLHCLGAAASIGGRLWAREHHNPEFEQHHVRILDTIRSRDTR
jgi:hypothetical protein